MSLYPLKLEKYQYKLKFEERNVLHRHYVLTMMFNDRRFVFTRLYNTPKHEDEVFEVWFIKSNECRLKYCNQPFNHVYGYETNAHVNDFPALTENERIYAKLTDIEKIYTKLTDIEKIY
ncbi:hypothetical protein EBU95_16465, partial [bacterium]|nr:hypothetical protein [bacterium]